MKQFFTFLLLLTGTFLNAQTISDFENISMPSDSFLNGNDGSGGFTVGNVFLPNFYNDAWESWSGWSISNKTDVSTPGPMNQYSSITGSGFDNSSNYGVAFASGNSVALHLEGMAAGETVNGLYITNNTYAYLSMRDGDMFAKKFGGVTGNDPDYLFVTVKKYLNDVLSQDSVDFYLADYRFDDNDMDYIVNEWTYLDLTSLGAADSLLFTFYSTDFSVMFGINTPKYFCVDNITTSDGTTAVTDLISPPLFEIFPNPSSDFIILKNTGDQEVDCIIYDVLGNQVYVDRIFGDQQQIDISDLAKGTYIVEVRKENLQESRLLIVE